MFRLALTFCGVITFALLTQVVRMAAQAGPTSEETAKIGPFNHETFGPSDQRNHRELGTFERASQSAASNVDSVKYDFNMLFKPLVSPDTVRITGSALIVRAPEDSIYNKHFRLNYTHAGKHIEFLYNGGDTVLTLLHYKKTAFLVKRLRSNVRFTNREANHDAIVQELFDGLRLENIYLPINTFEVRNPAPPPNDSDWQESAITSLTLQAGSLFNKSEAGKNSTWWFNSTSLQPFRKETKSQDLNLESYRMIELSNVKINPAEALSPQINNYQIPEGYEVQDFINMSPKPRKARPKLLQPGVDAPVFNGALLDGGDFTLQPGQGKVYLLDFWFVNCPPCHRATPYLKQLQEDFGAQGLQVVGVNRTDNSESGKRLMQHIVNVNKITYPQVLGTHAIDSLYGVSGYPTLVLINKQGKVQLAFSGFSEGQMQGLRDAIANNLQDSGR